MTVRQLLSKDRQVRVEIHRRDNGTFGYRVFRWDGEGPEGPHWCLLGGQAESFTASADDAEREARARVAGMADAVVVSSHG